MAACCPSMPGETAGLVAAATFCGTTASQEVVSPGLRLELFGRQPADGWTVWGDQVGARGEGIAG
jgi:hypothetical protein